MTNDIEAAATDEPQQDIPVEGEFGMNPSPSKSLVLPKGTRRLVNFAAEREADNWEPESVGFSARVWAQVSLPYNDPGEVPVWIRRNGNITLRVQPSSFTDETGQDITAYPYGIMPRHIMTWMATEAHLTKSPELELGASMNAFMEKLGVKHGGGNRKQLRQQMERVFGSRLSVEGLGFGEEGEGYGVKRGYFQVADEVDLWFSEKEEVTSDGLWSSKVLLSDKFYESIVSHPIPVDPGALRVLGSAPLRIDIYIWVGYRLYSLRRPTRIRWSDLYVQFGSSMKRVRDFKAQFIKALRDIQIIFPKLKFDVEAEYLLLYPGPTPVEQTSKRQQIKQ